MPSADVPPDVARFLAAHVDSVADLEILLYLRAHPLVEWDGRALADLLGMPRDTADAILLKLHESGIARNGEQSTQLYRYAPLSAATETVIDQLAAVCDQHKFAVVAQILANQANASLRSFSDAFRIRPASRAATPGRDT